MTRQVKRFFYIIFFCLMCCVFNLTHYNIKAEQNGVSVNYQTHVQNIGWENPVEMGQSSGTTGDALRVEALKIHLENPIPGMSLIYQAHVQNIGWQSWVNDGQVAGTEGMSLRVEAIRVKILGSIGYHVQYQARVQGKGWMPYVEDGDISGTIGLGLRIEEIRINIIKDTDNTIVPENIKLNYLSHVQNVGWQNQFTDLDMAGTTGQGLRVEALKVNLENSLPGMKIKYQAHVQNIGWQDWTEDGQLAGTVGKGLRIEALRIQLEGVPGYHVQYQTHVSNIGWQDWVQDGQTAGTVGQALRIEALRIRIVKDNIDTVQPILYLDKTNDNKTITDSSDFNISGYALNQLGYKQIEIYFDNSIVGKAIMDQDSSEVTYTDGYLNPKNSGYTYLVNTSNLSPGKHTIIVQAIGNNQDVVRDSVSFNIPFITYTKYNTILDDYVNREMKLTPAISTGIEWHYAYIKNSQYGYLVNTTDPNGQWVNSLDEYNNIKNQVIYNTNPVNMVNDSVKKYQFLKLNYSDCTNAEQLNSILKGVLSGKGQVFIDAAKANNINPIYLASHAILETGNGTSNLAKGIVVNGNTVYNLFGIHAFDSDPEGSGSAYAYQCNWTSIDLAIFGGAKWIANGYIGSTIYKQNTLYKMRWNPSISLISHQYATDTRWATNQTYYIKKCFDLFPTVQLTFDIPVYN